MDGRDLDHPEAQLDSCPSLASLPRVCGWTWKLLINKVCSSNLCQPLFCESEPEVGLYGYICARSPGSPSPRPSAASNELSDYWIGTCCPATDVAWSIRRQREAVPNCMMPPRLGHRKSRKGCLRCKQRRVKVSKTPTPSSAPDVLVTNESAEVR